MNRGLVLLLILIAGASSLPLVESVYSSISKPSVPEFTVELVDSSYDVPTTYSTDPYTGENVTHPGYHVESTSIQIKIENQPFTPFWVQESPSAANWSVNFYYNVRIKGHYSEDWIELYRASDGYMHQDSDAEYTVRKYPLGIGTDTVLGTKMMEFPPNAEVDFQVEAMIGYVSRVYVPNYTGPNMYPYRLTGERSGWSETQTLTLNVSTDSEIPEQPDAENESSQLDQSTLIFAGALILIPIAAGLGLLIYLGKRQ